MTKERIEDMREVVLPFVKKRLLETNYENLGKSDAEEFAREFNEILDLAIKALEQETVSKESYDHEYFLRKKMEAEIDHLRRHISKLETQITLEQEPRKGEWLRMSDLSEKEDDRYQCSYCGNVVHYKSKMDLYTFNSWCGRCGCDNDWRKCIEGN